MPDEAGAMFDRSFANHAPDLAIVPEEAEHRPFLDALFIACSPLRGMLPDAVVEQQAVLRETAYRADYPAAMRRVVLAGGVPVARIVVNWTDGAAMLVDIAVVPEKQRTGVGRAMLHAYLDVADQRGKRAMLQVMRDNPAQQLYAGFGFVAVEPQDFAPYLDMVREPRG